MGDEELPGGGLRARMEQETVVEPASAYAAVHKAPMPMKWAHGEDIGRIVALRRAHGQLYTVAECELEPDDLQLLTEQRGDLKWSTGTNNRRRELLRIEEVSLTPSPASIGLPAVKWWKLDVTKGNLPSTWVREELARADKTEYRSRGELRVHEADPTAAWKNLDRGFDPYEMSYHPGRIIAVEGRPVRR